MLITIFEHQIIFNKIDIPEPCFYWLIQQVYPAFTLTHKNGKVGLKARQYIGMIGTPFGTQIEILPKVFGSNQHSILTNATKTKKDIAQNRLWLNHLLNRDFLQLSHTQNNLAQQSSIDGLPIHAFLVATFLDACRQIHRIGMSQSYQNQPENAPYLRGKIAVVENIRQNQAKLRHHYFVQTSDVRSYQSPENRLIIFALFLLTQHPLYQQHDCLQQYQQFSGVLTKNLTWQQLKHYQQRQYLQDHQKCQFKRLPKPYQQALPIAKLILAMQSSGAGFGKTFGVSLLFNMHDLFEKMVRRALNKYLNMQNPDTQSPNNQKIVQTLNHLPAHALSLLTSDKDSNINTHAGFFSLKPDNLICANGQITTIVDCKWKWLDATNIKKTLQRADIYQMIAYVAGYFDIHQTHDVKREVWLIYPQTEAFETEMTFQFSAFKHIVLKIKPFNLQQQCFK